MIYGSYKPKRKHLQIYLKQGQKEIVLNDTDDEIIGV